MIDVARHWDTIWGGRDGDEVGWLQAEPTLSLALVAASGIPFESPIIDVGGGTSRLATSLLELGHCDVTVLDVSAVALREARARWVQAAARAHWIYADVLTHRLERRYSLWHDRAVFHFMTDAADRAAYLDALHSGLAANGHVIIATFSPEAPGVCSGLSVRRYDEDGLRAALGERFVPVQFRRELHTTPTGVEQPFVYGLFRSS